MNRNLRIWDTEPADPSLVALSPAKRRARRKATDLRPTALPAAELEDIRAALRERTWPRVREERLQRLSEEAANPFHYLDLEDQREERRERDSVPLFSSTLGEP